MTVQQIISLIFSIAFLFELGWICWYLWRQDVLNRKLFQAKQVADTEAILNATAAAQNAAAAAKQATDMVMKGLEMGHQTASSIQQIAKILAEHEMATVLKSQQTGTLT
jgi:hypothetical protein